MLRYLMFCKREIINTYNYLDENKEYLGIIFLSIPDNMLSTKFRIMTKNLNKISIAHTEDTSEELQTVLLNDDYTINKDSLVYHKNREDLFKYISKL